MTPKRAIQLKHQYWIKWCVWFKAQIQSAFPDTGGSELFMHNWYICGKDQALADKANALKDQAWNRLHKADDRFDAALKRAEHHRHTAQGWHPGWCEFCRTSH